MAVVADRENQQVSDIFARAKDCHVISSCFNLQHTIGSLLVLIVFATSP